MTKKIRVINMETLEEDITTLEKLQKNIGQLPNINTEKIWEIRIFEKFLVVKTKIGAWCDLYHCSKNSENWKIDYQLDSVKYSRKEWKRILV